MGPHPHGRIILRLKPSRKSKKTFAMKAKLLRSEKNLTRTIVMRATKRKTNHRHARSLPMRTFMDISLVDGRRNQRACKCGRLFRRAVDSDLSERGLRWAAMT